MQEVEKLKQLVVVDYNKNERYLCSLVFKESELEMNDIMDLVAMEHFKRNPDDSLLKGLEREAVVAALEIVGVVDVEVQPVPDKYFK